MKFLLKSVLSDDIQTDDVANFEKVSETQTCDYEIPLGHFLGGPLKHPFYPCLTSRSNLHGQPRTYLDSDSVAPPALRFESPYPTVSSSSLPLGQGSLLSTREYLPFLR